MNTLKEIDVLHNEVLYPTVRVMSLDLGGSGTVVYSKKNSRSKVDTYIMTNFHVVENAITIEEKWIASIGKKMDKEFKKTVRVETFKYNNFSRCIGSNSIEADIVAYDQDEDMALLKTRDVENVIPNVVHIFPIVSIDEICIFDKVYNVGATLGHPPIPSLGEITFMDDEIDNYNFWLVSAAMYFGDSGGATMRFDTSRCRWEYIGIPSQGEYSPDGINTVPNFGYMIPIDRIYRFWDENCYQFIYDPNADIDKCYEAREKNKKLARSSK